MVIHQQDCYENENSKKVFLEEHAEKVFGWDCCNLHPKLGLLLSVHVDDKNMAGKQDNFYLQCGQHCRKMSN